MENSSNWNTTWIDSEPELNKAIKLLSAEEIISVDTETVGWDTGNERLCLIQLGLPSRQEVIIVDPLAIQDIKPLEPILSNKTPQLVAHNASFEEKQFGRYGLKMRGIIDTLEMARRLRPDLPNHTLQTCCKLLLDLDISKVEQTSDWSRRPLTPEQLRYAALDAEVAFKLYEILAALQARLEINPNLKIPELMADMAGTLRQRLELTKSIATELAYLHAREEMLRQTIRTKLIDGAPPYDGQYGKCKVTRVKITEINPDKVRTELPSISEMVISEHVDKTRLKAVMKEHGIDEDLLEKVSDITGYTDRLNLSLKDFA